jgi:HEAT repeat protein
MMSALMGSNGLGHRTEADMPERRRTVHWIIGLMGLAVLVASVALTQRSKHRARHTPPVALDAKAPLSQIAQQLQHGDAKALGALFQRVMPRPDDKPQPVSEVEAGELTQALESLRTGYPKLSPYGRAAAMSITARILDKFTVDPAPPQWGNVLSPSHDLLTAGLADSALNVRVAALTEVTKLWVYTPGRIRLFDVEKQRLADWKQAFLDSVVRRLGDEQPVLRAAAVTCLAALPIDSAAAPASAYIADPDPNVRSQVLSAFADRRSLLTDETVLARLSDPDPRIPPLAEQVLKARGLTQEQIGLGGLIAHPRPEMRESVIPLLANRTDIDPVTWLVYLSRDEDESVRMKAAEALTNRDSLEARQRLAEMATSDPSVAVKKLAGHLIAPGEATAALPPLPGSPSLTPKAN